VGAASFGKCGLRTGLNHGHIAEKHALPAGWRLAVDRDPFAQSLDSMRLMAAPQYFLSNNGEITDLAANGALDYCDRPLDLRVSGANLLQPKPVRGRWPFFDASRRLSITTASDMSKRMQSALMTRAKPSEERNCLPQCPDDKDQYERFIDALWPPIKPNSKRRKPRATFDGCLRSRVMAERGPNLAIWS